MFSKQKIKDAINSFPATEDIFHNLLHSASRVIPENTALPEPNTEQMSMGQSQAFLTQKLFLVSSPNG